MKTETHVEKAFRLEQTFAGVKSPEQMGTTGLIGWVLVGGSCHNSALYNRVRTARKIIRARLGSAAVERFFRAVCAASHTRWHAEQVARYAAA